MVGVVIKPFSERKKKLWLDQQGARLESLLKVMSLHLTQIQLMPRRLLLPLRAPPLRVYHWPPCIPCKDRVYQNSTDLAFPSLISVPNTHAKMFVISLF